MRTKDIIAILYAVALPIALLCPADGTIVIRRGSFAAAPSWVRSEDFETGATTAGWTNVNGPSWSSTETGKSGSYCWSASGGSTYSWISLADGTYYEIVARVKFGNIAASGDNFFSIRTSGDTVVSNVRVVAGTSKMGVYVNGAGVETTDSVSNNTWYWVRYIWDEDGDASIEFVTDTGDTVPTFLGSGTKYISRAATAAVVGRFTIGWNQGGSQWVDQLIVYNSNIPAGSTP